MMAYVHNRKSFPVAVVNHIIQPHSTDYIDIPSGMTSNNNVTISYDGLTKEDTEPVTVVVDTPKVETVNTAQKRGRKTRQNIKESE